jgi:mannose-6-phosphate isomerase
MTASDNVVRAGLTSKFKDVDTLRVMLDFCPKSFSEFEVQPKFINDSISLYRPPIDSFSVLRITLKQYQTEYFQALHTHSIMICIYGSSTLCPNGKETRLESSPGKVFFIGPDAGFYLENQSDIPCIFYRAIGLSNMPRNLMVA